MQGAPKVSIKNSQSNRFFCKPGGDAYKADTDDINIGKGLRNLMLVFPK
jgi:hypothetical protein